MLTLPRIRIFLVQKLLRVTILQKQMIRFIVELGEVINNDPRVNDKMKVVYLEAYRVTLAELMIPAADISEQIFGRYGGIRYRKYEVYD